MDVEDLNVLGIIGFNGEVKHGLQIHPDGKHLIYGMGNKITLKDVDSRTQTFLSGHTNVITTLCISPCGRFIASGQMTELSFKAMVIVWNFENRNIEGSYKIHKGKVEDLCFTCQSNFLISLGGKDDGNIVIWDVNKNIPVCGSFASTEIAGSALTISRVNTRDQCFLSGGDGTLKVWRIDYETRKIHGINIKVGKLRRCINCIAIEDNDMEAYCGTSSGDIIKIRLNYDIDQANTEPLQTPVIMGCYSKIPDKMKTKNTRGQLYTGGVTNLLLLENKRILVGTGTGIIELVEIVHFSIIKQSIKLPSTPQIRTLKVTNVRGAVTSMRSHEGKTIVVGTSQCEIYHINPVNLDTKLVITCHTDAVYDIAFPHNFSDIFATGSKNDIRLWLLQSQKELLRITVPNFVCTSLYFSYDGKLILSAWNDGVVRAFKPQSGKLFFAINNAHVKAVSAISLTKNGKTLITGGCDGQIRVWQISKEIQRLVALLKEHRGSVTSIDVTENDEEVVSSSTDGTCVIWDIKNFVRKQVIMGNTMYMSARFHPNGLQILTCGTDRNVAYWETLDGSIIREVEGSTVGSINCLDISADGQYFITGGNDCLLKFWEYTAGNISHVGTGHAATITACKFSPDGLIIVSSSSDGAVIIWNNPIHSKSMEKKINPHIASQRSESKDENVIISSQRSSSTKESVHIMHEGNETNNQCDYDPIRPGKDSCRCEKMAEKPESLQETLDRQSTKSDGILEIRRKSRNSISEKCPKSFR